MMVVDLTTEEMVLLLSVYVGRMIWFHHHWGAKGNTWPNINIRQFCYLLRSMMLIVRLGQ